MPQHLHHPQHHRHIGVGQGRRGLLQDEQPPTDGAAGTGDAVEPRAASIIDPGFILGQLISVPLPSEDDAPTIDPASELFSCGVCPPGYVALPLTASLLQVRAVRTVTTVGWVGGWVGACVRACVWAAACGPMAAGC